MCAMIRTPLCNKMLFSVRYRMGCWGNIGLVGGGRLFWKPARLSGNSPEGPVMGQARAVGGQDAAATGGGQRARPALGHLAYEPGRL